MRKPIFTQWGGILPRFAGVARRASGWSTALQWSVPYAFRGSWQAVAILRCGADLASFNRWHSTTRVYTHYGKSVRPERPHPIACVWYEP